MEDGPVTLKDSSVVSVRNDVGSGSSDDKDCGDLFPYFKHRKCMLVYVYLNYISWITYQSDNFDVFLIIQHDLLLFLPTLFY